MKTIAKQWTQTALIVAAAVSFSDCIHINSTKESFMGGDGAQKAAFDLQCDKDQLDVTELGKMSVGVRGCGKQARYEWVKTSPSTYEWVNNSN